MESGIASAAAALAWTGRLTVGIGLLPVPLRNVALTAMEAATIDRLFPGRIRLGVGHGVQEWMGQVGVRAESPMTLLREYVVALRQLLAGDRVTTQGRYVHLDGVALDWPPSAPVPIHVGAVGPRTLRLSGEVGDGTILTMVRLAARCAPRWSRSTPDGRPVHGPARTRSPSQCSRLPVPTPRSDCTATTPAGKSIPPRTSGSPETRRRWRPPYGAGQTPGPQPW